MCLEPDIRFCSSSSSSSPEERRGAIEGSQATGQKIVLLRADVQRAHRCANERAKLRRSKAKGQPHTEAKRRLPRNRRAVIGTADFDIYTRSL